MAHGKNGQSGQLAKLVVEKENDTKTGCVPAQSLEEETVKENGRRSQFAEL